LIKKRQLLAEKKEKLGCLYRRQHTIGLCACVCVLSYMSVCS